MYRRRYTDSLSSRLDATADVCMMRQSDETTRLPPGYSLDLIGDPCVIVLRRADGAVVARFTRSIDPEEVRRAAEEDQRGPFGEGVRGP